MNNKFTKPEIEFLNFVCDETQEFDSYTTRVDGSSNEYEGNLKVFDNNQIPD